MDPLKHLNEAQKQAVLTTQGPLLVLAGAGAGKTRVIAHRILQIVKSGVAPGAILAITFTNKAAGEMRERVRALLRSPETPFVSTFHSLGLTIIKENLRALRFQRTPTIFDRSDSLRAMKQALKALGAEGEIEPRAALGTISRQKGSGTSATNFATTAENARARLIAALWQAYDRELSKEGALDFDDLLLRAVELLRKDAAAREHYKNRWTHLHIDEYQDTNRVQNELAELLVGVEQNICVVGDVDQTIYGWRGAEIANILSFEKKFPTSRVIVLEENYRSSKTILAAANDVIVKNIYRPEKNLFTNNAAGEKLGLYQAFDETDEAAFVARKIGELTAQGAAPRDIAVLYRANFQSRAIEEALLASDIPYQVVGTRFFERKEVKDTLSFIRAARAAAPADIARVANVPPRGIGKVTLLKLLSGQPAGEKVAAFKNLLKKINEAVQKRTPSELVQLVIKESGMERFYKEDSPPAGGEGAERLENLRELATLAARYDHYPLGEGLEKFLESAALASEQDELKEEQNAARLMTVHASKGLEFPYIFIVGLEEGLFPYDPSTSSGQGDRDAEEERRLMYVALTRAKQKVFLSYASYRTIFGSKNPTLPSQFLTDIGEELLELEAPDLPAGRQGGGKTIYLD